MYSRPTLRHIVPATCVLALSIASAIAAPPQESGTEKAQPTSTDKLERTLKQYAELRQMLELDRRCTWLEPVARAALEATIEERLAFYVSEDGKRDTADRAATTALKRHADLGCESTAAASLEHSIQLAAWQMRVTWALRGEALLPSEGRPAWFAAHSPTTQQAGALREAVNGLKKAYGPSIQRRAPAIQADAERMLSTRCTSSDKGCTLANTAPAFKQYADTWLKQSARYATALTKAPDKVGAPPETARP